jgi:hypothetical protein
VRVRPLSRDALTALLVDRVGSALDGRDRLRVGFDGAPTAGPAELADALVEPLRAAGHDTARVDTADFLRPASIRLELGRANPDAFYEIWYDHAALRREVLEPLAPGGTGRLLTTFWDPVRDRATRADYRTLAPGGVLLLSGPLLLGTGLALDLTVHCVQSPAALARRTPADEQWTLPAYQRYTDEVAPESFADVVLRMDDPTHPALVESAGIGSAG